MIVYGFSCTYQESVSVFHVYIHTICKCKCIISIHICECVIVNVFRCVNISAKFCKAISFHVNKLNKKCNTKQNIYNCYSPTHKTKIH